MVINNILGWLQYSYIVINCFPNVFFLFQYIPEWCFCRDYKNISKYYRHFIIWPEKKTTYLSQRSRKTARKGIFLQLRCEFLIPQSVFPKLHSLFWHNARKKSTKKHMVFPKCPHTPTVLLSYIQCVLGTFWLDHHEFEMYKIVNIQKICVYLYIYE